MSEPLKSPAGAEGEQIRKGLARNSRIECVCTFHETKKAKLQQDLAIDYNNIVKMFQPFQAECE